MSSRVSHSKRQGEGVINWEEYAHHNLSELVSQWSVS